VLRPDRAPELLTGTPSLPVARSPPSAGGQPRLGRPPRLVFSSAFSSPLVGSAHPAHEVPYVYLAIAILAEVIGTSALKSADGFTKLRPSLVVVVAYGVSFYFLSLALQAIPVGIAYAIWSGVGVALITLIGWFIFKQKLDAAALWGVGLIVAGVVVIQMSSMGAR
jgi:small multidrug resistance pump